VVIRPATLVETTQVETDFTTNTVLKKGVRLQRILFVGEKLYVHNFGKRTKYFQTNGNIRRRHLMLNCRPFI
jgi:hypothetical protein